MNTLIALEGFTRKVKDTKHFKMQLVTNGTPFAIPEGAVLTVVIKQSDQSILRITPTIVNKQEGIISIQTMLGIGSYSLEVICIYDNGNEKTTFPTINYENIQVSANLKDM